MVEGIYSKRRYMREERKFEKCGRID